MNNKTSSFILSDEASTFNATEWERFENTFYQRQDEELNFVSCAEKCFQKHATLPCIENPVVDEWLFDQYGDDLYWIGLFQFPGHIYSSKNWNNWQPEGCDSSYRNWDIITWAPDGKLMKSCALGGWNGVNTWNDAQCADEIRCICQYAENSTGDTSFFENEGITLIEQSGEYPITTQFVIIVIFIVTVISVAISLLLKNLRLLKELKGTKNFVSKRTLTLVLLGLVAFILNYGYYFIICFIIIIRQYDAAPHAISLFLLTLINIIIGFIISLTIIFNLIDSAALATGGVKETRKLWIKFSRVFIIPLPILSLFFACYILSLAFVVNKVTAFNMERGEIAIYLTFSVPYIILSLICFVVYLKIYTLEKSPEMQIPESIRQSTNVMYAYADYEEVKKLSKFLGSILLFMGFGFLMQVFFSTSVFGQLFLWTLRIYPVFNLLIYFLILRYTSKRINSSKCNIHTHKKNQRNSTVIPLYPEGKPIYDTDGQVIGRAPHAPLPIALNYIPSLGQNDVEPIRWSISLENLIKFLRLCMATETWKVLAAIKGENNICMHDINAHFVIPWTKGKGCSIALLFDPDPQEVELMISHSWSASVIQTYNALNSLPLMHMVSMKARVFFCTLCQYQAGDEDNDNKGSDDEDDISTRRKSLVRNDDVGIRRPSLVQKQSSLGLSIRDQLDKDPFSCIIKNEPRYGMFVIHTLISEVYSRLWCVFEVNEGLNAKIEMTALFDPTVWALSDFKKMMKVNTQEAECDPLDRAKLVRKIERQGGFERLDKTILQFRKEAFRDLKNALKMEFLLGVQMIGNDDIQEDINSSFFQKKMTESV